MESPPPVSQEPSPSLAIRPLQSCTPTVAYEIGELCGQLLLVDYRLAQIQVIHLVGIYDAVELKSAENGASGQSKVYADVILYGFTPEILAILLMDGPHPQNLVPSSTQERSPTVCLTIEIPLQEPFFNPSPVGSAPTPISVPTTSLKLWSPSFSC